VPPFVEHEVVPVRFNGIVAGCVLLLIAPLFGGMVLLAPSLGIFFGILFAGFAVPALLMIGASFDTRPLLVVEPGGVRLPCAGDILLGYDEIEVWAEKIRDRHDAYWTFSLQRRPRLHLDIPWWTWLRFVRVNTLTDGDLHLESRFITVQPQMLAALIQERIDRATAAG
jgi:hypothetical protein